VVGVVVGGIDVVVVVGGIEVVAVLFILIIS
jgi:hypothetical protein